VLVLLDAPLELLPSALPSWSTSSSYKNTWN